MLRDALIALKKYVGLSSVVSAALALLYLAPVGYMRDVYGSILNSRSISALGWITLLLAVAIFFTAILEWLRSRIQLAASIKLYELLIKPTFETTFFNELRGHPSRGRAIKDLQVLRRFISSNACAAMLDTPFGLFFLALVFAIHPTMGFMSLLGALTILVVGLITENRVRPTMNQSIAAYSEAQAFLEASGRNAASVKAMRMINNVESKWFDKQSKHLKFQAQASLSQAMGSGVSKFVIQTQGSIILGVGVFLTITGALPPEAGAYLIVAKILGGLAVRPMMQVIGSWKQILFAYNAYKSLDDLLRVQTGRPEHMPLPPPSGQIDVIGLVVRSEATRTDILRGLDFALSPGESLGVMGPSGSGKSTLARCLVGGIFPALGAVRLDSANIAKWDKNELGPSIGYLPQDIQLFDGSIRENIARFGEANGAALDRTIELAGLAPLITRLPQGLDTQIGDGGGRLSGGERQLIGLARAIYGRPKLVVLDEPNANLDSHGELILQELIGRLKAECCTVVIVTHKRSLLNHLDKLALLVDGRLKLFGDTSAVVAQIEARQSNKKADK